MFSLNNYNNYTDDVKRLYDTKRWEELRAEVIRRDEGRDKRTGELITGRYIVDHIQPATVSNFFDIDNLQLLSIESHNIKTFHELSMEYIKRKKREHKPVTDLIPFD